MRFWLSIVLFACVAPSYAGIYFISDGRSVSASGHANSGQGTADFQRSDLPNPSFSDFATTVNSNAASYSAGTGPNGLDVSAYSSSIALQRSSVSSSGFYMYSHVAAQTWSDLPTWGGVCGAVAESIFSITFSVAEMHGFELSFDRSFFAHDYPNLIATCSLSSLESGLIFEVPTSPLGGELYTGTLLPDQTYTLDILLRASAGLPDPLSELGIVTAEMYFNIVPEPSTFALLSLGAAFLLRKAYKLKS